MLKARPSHRASAWLVQQRARQLARRGIPSTMDGDTRGCILHYNSRGLLPGGYNNWTQVVRSDLSSRANLA
jgi:hypothetical protein